MSDQSINVVRISSHNLGHVIVRTLKDVPSCDLPVVGLNFGHVLTHLITPNQLQPRNCFSEEIAMSDEQFCTPEVVKRFAGKIADLLRDICPTRTRPLEFLDLCQCALNLRPNLNKDAYVQFLMSLPQQGSPEVRGTDAIRVQLPQNAQQTRSMQIESLRALAVLFCELVKIATRSKNAPDTLYWNSNATPQICCSMHIASRVVLFLKAEADLQKEHGSCERNKDPCVVLAKKFFLQTKTARVSADVVQKFPPPIRSKSWNLSDLFTACIQSREEIIFPSTKVSAYKEFMQFSTTLCPSS